MSTALVITPEIALAVTTGKDLIEKMKERAELATVNSDVTAEHCTSLIKAIKLEADKYDAKRLGFVEEKSKFVREVNAEFKPIKDALSAAEGVLKKKLGTYQLEQQRIAREKQQKIEDDALAAATKLEEEGNVEAANMVVDSAAKLKTRSGPVRGTVGGSSSTRSVWKYNIQDLDKVPRAFLMLDDQAVRQAIADGTRDIAGLEIYEDAQVTVR